MQKRIVLVLFALFLQPLAIAETTDVDESREAHGGHAILLEQYTATWCDSCATIDPWITDFVDSHSTRVVRVALHPDDHDPFGSPLTTHRIGMKQAEHQLQLPTFWFDGQDQLEGVVSQSLLANELRSAENRRSDWIVMSVEWNTWDHEVAEDTHAITIRLNAKLAENSTMTVFRIQSLEMTSEIANNGIDVHHDVATQMITVDENDNVTHSFEGIHGWTITDSNLSKSEGDVLLTLETKGDVDGFVTIIEENGEVRGVLGIHDVENPRNPEKSMNLTLFWLVLALVTSSILVSRDK
tara:strand:+ start:558 stop:1448 length:891 start_codon:yes stop_codon:yes gene_type:complete